MKPNSIKTGNDLMKNAIAALGDFRGNDGGANKALYPVLVVFLGDKAVGEKKDGEEGREQYKYVKQTLDDNWANNVHLQYIFAEAEGGEAYGTILERDESDLEVVQWSSERVNFTQAAKTAVHEMRKLEGNIFDDPSRYKIDFILDATDENAEDLYKVYSEYDDASSGAIKTLYLLLNQGPLEENIEKSDKLLKTVLADHPEGVDNRNIFLISNVLKNERVVAKVEETYRMIADIIILGGNNNKNIKTSEAQSDLNINTGVQVLERGVKAVSYHIAGKPNNEIGEIAIDAVLREIYNEEEKHVIVDSADSLFCERFGVSTGTGTIDKSDKLFEKVRDFVEDRINPLAIKYFPYREVGHVEAYSKKSVTVAEIDADSYGTCTAYIKLNISDPIEKYFEEEKRKEEITNDLAEEIISTFNYFELLAIKREQDIVKSSILSEYAVAQTGGGDAVAMFRRILEEEIKKAFYYHYKRLLWDAMQRVMDKVDEFAANYDKICKEMEVARDATGEENENREAFYKREVSEYIRRKAQIAARGKAIFDKVFDIHLDKSGLLMAIFGEYENHIKEGDVYKLNFVAELSKIFDGKKNENDIVKMVLDEFPLVPDMTIRFKNYPNRNFRVRSEVKFWMVNRNAKFFKVFAENLNAPDYSFFDIKRTDCIERLEIYTIQDPSEIHLKDSKNE